jgi:hypothetical protein
MAFGVLFTHSTNHQFLFSLLDFIINPVLVIWSQIRKNLECLLVLFLMFLFIVHFQTQIPFFLVQIRQHFMFKLILSKIDIYRIVTLIQPIHQRLK